MRISICAAERKEWEYCKKQAGRPFSGCPACLRWRQCCGEFFSLDRNELAACSEEGGIHGQLGGTIPLTGKFPQDSSSATTSSETDSKWVSHSDMENQMYTVLAFVMGYTGSQRRAP